MLFVDIRLAKALALVVVEHESSKESGAFEAVTTNPTALYVKSGSGYTDTFDAHTTGSTRSTRGDGERKESAADSAETGEASDENKGPESAEKTEESILNGMGIVLILFSAAVAFIAMKKVASSALSSDPTPAPAASSVPETRAANVPAEEALQHKDDFSK